MRATEPAEAGFLDVPTPTSGNLNGVTILRRQAEHSRATLEQIRPVYADGSGAALIHPSDNMPEFLDIASIPWICWVNLLLRSLIKDLYP